ncbi:MAG: hypothetical protein SGARI_008069, partial [Bacillariaceae sp.]
MASSAEGEESKGNSMEAELQEKMTVSSPSPDDNNATSAAKPTSDDEQHASALRDNIARKGKNAYYFAHAHKATGPKWDGKAEPKLLKKQASTVDDEEKKKQTPSFQYHKSNITSYAFLNEEKVVKLYLTMEEVGEKCQEEDITLDWNESSFSLVVKNYLEEEQCLSFGKLSGKISDAKFKLKPNKIILTLKKEKEG